MPFLDWNREFSVGEPKLDDQHEQWIGYINSLHASVQSGQFGDEQLEILDNLIIYTRYHFASEENCLKRVDYPHIEDHHRIHAELTAQALAMQKAVKSGQTEKCLEFLTWFRSWIVDHILQEDTKYRKYLAKHAEPELVSIP